MSLETRTPSPPTFSGFTLLEAVVALAVSGTILVGSAALVSALADATSQVQETAVRMAASGNAERSLFELAANLIPTEGAEVALSGTRWTLTFNSRCPRPGGWLAPCTVTWAIDPEGIHVDRSGQHPVVYRPAGNCTRFRFLVNAEGGGTWAASWESVVPPLAIGVDTDGGTLVFPIGVQR